MPQQQCSVLKGCLWVGGSGDTTWGTPKLWEWLSFFKTELHLLCEELSQLPVEHLAGRPSRSSLQQPSLDSHFRAITAVHNFNSH